MRLTFRRIDLGRNVASVDAVIRAPRCGFIAQLVKLVHTSRTRKFVTVVPKRKKDAPWGLAGAAFGIVALL